MIGLLPLLCDGFFCLLSVLSRRSHLKAYPPFPSHTPLLRTFRKEGAILKSDFLKRKYLIFPTIFCGLLPIILNANAVTKKHRLDNAKRCFYYFVIIKVLLAIYEASTSSSTTSLPSCRCYYDRLGILSSSSKCLEEAYLLALLYYGLLICP